MKNRSRVHVLSKFAEVSALCIPHDETSRTLLVIKAERKDKAADHTGNIEHFCLYFTGQSRCMAMPNFKRAEVCHPTMYVRSMQSSLSVRRKPEIFD